MTVVFRVFLLSLLALATACGGGGGSSSGGGGGGKLPAEDVPAGPTGMLRNADVTASVRDSAAGAWTTLATTTTDDQGHFSLDIEPQAEPVKVVVESVVGSRMRCDAPAGCGNAGTGQLVDAPEGFRLSAIVPGDQVDTDTTIAVTPLTHIAATWVENMPLAPSDARARLALVRVAELFGLQPDFVHNLPADLAADGIADSADDDALRHAIFAAAFAELAETESLDGFTVINDSADMFGVLGGQALNLSGEITAAELEQMILDLGLDPETVLAEINTDALSVSGLDSLVAAATSVGDDINEGGTLDSMIAGFDDLVAADRTFTALGGETDYDTADFDQALVVLDDYDHYRSLAIAGDDTVVPENRGLGWLYIDETARTDTEGLLTVLSEALGYAIDAAICVPEHMNNIHSCDVDPPYASLIMTDDLGGYWLDGHLEISGSRHGQTVDLMISAEDIRDLLTDGEMPITIDGTVDNGTAETELHLTVDLDITDNDLDGFNALGPLEFANSETIDPLLEDLMADLHINIALSGNGSITSTDEAIGSYTFSNLDSFVEFNRRVLTQDEDAPLLDIALLTGERSNPAGETLSDTATGADAFRLLLDDPATLQQAYSFDRLGLPEMTFTADGELSGLTPVLDVLGQHFEALLDGTATVEELDIDYDALLADLDSTLLTMTGGAELDIDDTTEGNKTYQFTLEDGRIHVSAPNSTETALTLTLSGLAGYIHAGDTLVATAHAGNADEGMLLSLVNDTRRTYPPQDNNGQARLEAFYLLLESLASALSSTEA